jgi:RNA polymerase sigma-70 factor (ECF subfamily)
MSARTARTRFASASNARAGSALALGQLLEGCRQYLLVAAARGLDAALASKGGPSNVVQRTFLEAQRDFHQFVGDSEAELIAWAISCGFMAPPLGKNGWFVTG